VHVLGRPGAEHVDDPWELLDQVTAGGANGVGAAVVGTPDQLVTAIRRLYEVTGGFGVVLGFAHDWADREASHRSWELMARYVVPEINGYVRNLQASAQYVHDNKAELMAGASAAVISKIMSHEGAAKALATTMEQMAAEAAKKASGEQKAEPESAFRPGAGLPTS
jgi:limonene 1,2-monooxygenase